MALLLKLARFTQGQCTLLRAHASKAASWGAHGMASDASPPDPKHADGRGTIFNTAGAAALAADPGIPSVPPEPTAAPVEPLKQGARLQPAAGVSPAAAAAAAEAAAAAAAADRAEAEARNDAADAAAGGAAAGADDAAGGGGGGAAAAENFAAGDLSEEQRDVLATIVREALASEAAAEQLVRAQRAVMGGRRPDLAAAAEDAAQAAETLKALAPALRARPSALGPLWGVAGAAAGAAAGLAPGDIANAIRGGAAEALTERYTGHLRRLASAGLGDSPAAGALRGALRTLRDVPRRPDGAPPVPDLVSIAMNQQLPRNMSVAEGVGGLTKLAFQGMFAVASHV